MKGLTMAPLWSKSTHKSHGCLGLIRTESSLVPPNCGLIFIMPASMTAAWVLEHNLSKVDTDVLHSLQ
jgi:hypothetical protein